MADDPALLDTIERYADEVLARSGLDPARRAAARDEIVDHLLTAAERSVTPVDALQLVRRFGSAPMLAQQLRVEELKRDIRAAWSLPRALLALVSVDLVARVVTTAIGGTFAETALAQRTATMVLACVLWTSAYWLAATALRLGYRWLARGIRYGAGSRVAAMGGAATLLGVSTWLGLAPGLLALRALAFLSYEQFAQAHLVGLLSMAVLVGGAACEATTDAAAADA
ncbi:MAG: hypothetical protein U0164_24050 [Gemmatimonadaceae bacterium]